MEQYCLSMTIGINEGEPSDYSEEEMSKMYEVIVRTMFKFPAGLRMEPVTFDAVQLTRVDKEMSHAHHG